LVVVSWISGPVSCPTFSLASYPSDANAIWTKAPQKEGQSGIQKFKPPKTKKSNLFLLGV
jgi:hypothetical protein